ncbi:Holliday junction recognition protein isoform X2 [Loxodonta africana]|uniref:Holliday junction recognition protein isoform X2 n=1 Tax=Loxodonta africana TaxID=9785 RepID=UPI000C810A19|nr:Holliday junction recognition protein isoform X2 [Loxodonta africana]
MAAEGCEEAELTRKLQDSRHRFQRRMQQLIEKYNHPFEDTVLVEMATLTYQTPQGLRLWGGGLIQERSKGQIQVEGSPVTPVSWVDSPGRAVSEDSKNNDFDATFDQGDEVAVAVMPAVLQSPLKNELRRKYLTQVDKLLQRKRFSQHADSIGQENTQMTLIPSLAEPVCDYGNVSAKNPGGPVQSASSLRECDPSADLAVVPRSDSFVSQVASSHSSLSSQPFEVEDVCDVTISDLYEGMLHSMSRLLSAKPSCIISTKTFIQNWHCRRRSGWKSRMNRTYCKGGRHTQRGPEEQRSPYSKPAKEVGTLNDPKNSLDVSCRERGFRLKKALLEVNNRQVHELVPTWKDPKVTPQKYSLLTYLDSSAVYDLDQENRLMTLKWLISPVKIMSKSRTLRGLGGSHHREIEVKFDKLHREYCPNPVSQACPPGPWAVDAYRGGPASHGCLQGLETHQSSISVPQRLHEGLEKPGEKSIEGSGWLPKRDSSSLLLSKIGPVQSTVHAERAVDSLLQGSRLGMFRRSLTPTKAISKPDIQPLGCRRNRFDDIKERFDRLHQEYCQRSPQQMKETFCAGQSPDRASVEAQYKKDFRGKTATDSALQSPQKSSSLPLWSIKSPSGSTTIGIHPLTCITHSPRRDHQSPAKRRRLSDPQVCGRWAESWNSTGVDRAIPSPRKEINPLRLDLEEKFSHVAGTSALQRLLQGPTNLPALSSVTKPGPRWDLAPVSPSRVTQHSGICSTLIVATMDTTRILSQAMMKEEPRMEEKSDSVLEEFSTTAL